jgi:aryl-alcohol dehydrogenase-like predicted oxidoreductase
MEKEVREPVAGRALGNTGITVSPLGFGCASVWGKNLISDREAAALFERAYELGIRFFDTGHSYGNAEERIGKTLRASSSVEREKSVISTTFGTRRLDGKRVHDVSPAWIRESVETSLRRMGIDYIDCLQVHGPIITDFTDELLNVICDLKKQGKVLAFGANSFDTDVLEYIRDSRCCDFVMLDYNITRPDREPLIRQLHDNGVGVIAGAALAQSLYSNRVFRLRRPKDVWYLARAVVKFRDTRAKGKKYSFINNVEA